MLQGVTWVVTYELYPNIWTGMAVALLGYTFKDEKGEAVLRAEYLWLNGKTYALRSNPA